MSDLVYLLHPGEYLHDKHWDADLLTANGRSQALSAGQELLRRGLGSTAYLLSSDETGALLTANRIAEALNSDVIVSPEVRLGSSDNWRAVKHLGEFLSYSLMKDAKTDPEPGRPFIAVVHAPLISSFKGVMSNQVECGKVEEFPFDASNPNYIEPVAAYIKARPKRVYSNW